MKLKIDDINIVADAAILKAISTTEFVGGETRFLADDFFVFSLGAVLGDHKPDNDDNGYWENNNKAAIDYISAVADAYDFPGNNATDVSSLDNWDDFGKYTILNTSEIRVEIKAIYDTIGAPIDDEKKVASKWFAVDKAVRDTVHGPEEQENNAELLGGLLVNDMEKGEIDGIKEAIKDADTEDINEATTGKQYLSYEDKKVQLADNTDYTLYTNQIIDFNKGRATEGELMLNIDITDRNCSVKVTNEAQTVEYGKIEGINVTGIKKIPLSNLPMNGVAIIKVLIKKDEAGGTSPDVGGYVIYHG